MSKLILLLALVSCLSSCQSQKKTVQASNISKEKPVKQGSTAAQELYKKGRLTARPKNEIKKEAIKYGLQQVDLGPRRELFLYIPTTYNPDKPSALAMVLHGSGGDAAVMMSLVQSNADA